MKKLFLLTTFLLLAATFASAQSVSVSARLVDGSGNAVPGAYLHFALYNCGTNYPVIAGSGLAIVDKSFDLLPNSSGLISGTIWPNDLILCGNMPSTLWTVTLMKSGATPLNAAQRYFICSATESGPPCAQAGGPGSVFDPSTAQPAQVGSQINYIPPQPGYILLFANPVTPQTWTQPAGTWGIFDGLFKCGPLCTFDFTGGTVIGLNSGGEFYQFIQANNAVVLPQEPTLNLLGSGVSCVVDVPNSRTNCTFAGSSGGGFNQTIYVTGTSYPQEPAFEFLNGAGFAISAVDNAGLGRTQITIAAPNMVQYSAPGGYAMNAGTGGNLDATQLFPCDSYKCALILGIFGTEPCCGESDGSIGIGPASLTNAVQHLEYALGGIWNVALSTADTVCDLSNNCTGALSPTVLQQNPAIAYASLYYPTIFGNLTVQTQDGNIFDAQPGLGQLIAGSLTSGTFQAPAGIQPGELVTQTGTLATTTFYNLEPSGNMLVTAILGSPNGSGTWVGNASGAIFTPSASPVTPYCQYAATAGHVYLCYGSDNRLQVSNNGGALSHVVLGSDSPTGPATAYSNSTTGLTTVLTSQSIPAGSLRNFDCYGVYNFTTAAEKADFGITASQTPQSITYWALIATNSTAGAANWPVPATSSGSVLQASAAANATGTNYPFEVHGEIQWNASTAGTFTLGAATSSASGTINIPAYSAHCKVN